MRSLLATFFVLMILALAAKAQQAASPAQLMLSIRNSKADTSRISLELQLGSYYLFKPGSFPNDMDSTIRHFNKAMQLSDQLRSDEWKYKTIVLIGDYQFEMGQFEKGTATINGAIAYYKQHHNLFEEGDAWETLGILLGNEGDGARARQIACYSKAVQLFVQAHDNDRALHVLLSAGYTNLRMGRLDTAESKYLSGIKLITPKTSKYTVDFEYQIALVYILKGMYHRALYYQLKVLAGLPAKVDIHTAGYWGQTGTIYSLLGMYEKALYYYNKALEGIGPEDRAYHFAFLSRYSLVLIALNKPQLALANITEVVKKNPPADLYQKGMAAITFAKCYYALKQYKLAANNFDAVMDLNKQSFENRTLDAFDIDRYVTSTCSVVDFFISTAQPQKAAVYFKRIAPFINDQVVFIPSKMKMLTLKIRLDSLSGDYKRAFTDLSIYKKINDSVYNSTNSQQIAELQTRYETSQKEHAIKLLQSQGNAQKLELQKAQLQRNITLAGVALMILLTGLAYNRYRFKQKTNNELEARQREINLKNDSLQHLISDKDKLLEEKDWLLKEVHHRVKNNLHTVICLLESQASYLEDDALKAIQVSQHRVYAMSLIHQKLYNVNSITTIDIASYLQEFAGYLADSFGTEGKITFDLQLQPLKMSVAQAIPVALIINEVVTNSIKYAFPVSGKGKISIGLEEYQDNITLTIADNGIGINPTLVHQELRSLGLALIKGLSTELKGELLIKNQNGTVISLTFGYDKLF